MISSSLKLIRAGLGLVYSFTALTGCSGSDAKGADGGGGQSSAGAQSDGGAETDGGAGARDPDACEPFSACGGDLTGKWNIVTECTSQAGLAETEDELRFCPTAILDIKSQTFSGSVTFDKAGQEKTNGTITAEASETIPSSCLTAGSDCSSLPDELKATGEVVADASCTDASSGDGCTCDITFMASGAQEKSFVSSGAAFTETDPSDGMMKKNEYCVSGTILRVKDDKGSIDVLTR